MKAAKPSAMRNGCAHHASRRIVWPNERVGKVASADVIGIRELAVLICDPVRAYQSNRSRLESGTATCSSDFRSAATPIQASIAAAKIIKPAPTR